MIKSISVTASLLLLILWPARGVENPPTEASPPASATSDEPEKPFRDPFASESKRAKAQRKIKDPLQPINRGFYHFNDKLYLWVMKPASKGYSKVVPRPARRCVRRFFENVEYPVHFVNNLLQGKFKAAAVETGRFAVNSTVGVAGLFDPATRWKIKAHPADFDQTLGVYGLAPWIYLDLPFFGPSSARGGAGLLADGMLSPWMYFGGPAVSLGIPGYNGLNEASFKMQEYVSLKKTTLDPYVAMRSAYYESRAAAVENAREKNHGKKSASTRLARGSD
jgi:phospholipid-binding lipoprotein MlaA